MSLNELNSTIKVSLIVPVRNEKDSIVAFVHELSNSLLVTHEILIVYDHPDDDTLLKSSEVLAINPSTRFIKNSLGPGFSNAIKTGFNQARAPLVIPIMADLSDTPETIPLMIKKIEEGFDVVVASRYCVGGKRIGGNNIKCFLSKMAGVSLHFLTNIPIHDLTTAFVVFKKDNLKQLNLKSNAGFEITIELIIKSYLAGALMTEVPTINQDRFAGVSKFKFFSLVDKYLYWYFYFLLHSPKKRLG